MAPEKKETIFAKIALKKGFISKGDLEECMQRKEELIEKGHGEPKLKDILIEADYLSAGQIEQIQEKVAENKDPRL